MRRTSLLATTLLAFPLALSAQSHPLVGAWTVSFVAGGRVGSEGFTPINGTGTLTVEAVGDSLVANLVTNPIEGVPPRPPLRMATVAKSGNVVFVSRSTAQLQVNGESREATSVNTWTLKVNGDALEGTTLRTLEGVEGLQMPPAQPVTGARKTS